METPNFYFIGLVFGFVLFCYLVIALFYPERFM